MESGSAVLNESQPRMVEIWKERVAQRQKRIAIEKGIVITIMTGAALFAASRQLKKGRGTDESICTSQSI